VTGQGAARDSYWSKWFTGQLVERPWGQFKDTVILFTVPWRCSGWRWLYTSVTVGDECWQVVRQSRFLPSLVQKTRSLLPLTERLDEAEAWQTCVAVCFFLYTEAVP
jgi:hypothetical protein